MAVKNLNTFFQTLIEKNARLQHQFQLQITAGLAAVDKAFEDVTMWAKSSSIPTLTQQTAEFPYLGVKFVVPTTFDFQREITLEIINDRDNTIRNGMLDWLNTISNTKILDGGSGEGPKTIPGTSKIRLQLYDPLLTTIVETYVLEGVFPGDVGELTVSNETPELSSFSAKFYYQFYHIEK